MMYFHVSDFELHINCVSYEVLKLMVKLWEYRKCGGWDRDLSTYCTSMVNAGQKWKKVTKNSAGYKSPDHHESVCPPRMHAMSLCMVSLLAIGAIHVLYQHCSKTDDQKWRSVTKKSSGCKFQDRTNAFAHRPPVAIPVTSIFK